MTENERETLTQFLRDLQQTRPLEVDEQANRLISEAISSHPHSPYVLASRCILLEKELSNLASKAPVNTQQGAAGEGLHSITFLGATLNDWCVNAQPVRQPFIASLPGGNANIPAHLLMEEKAINFLGKNALAVYICIIAVSAVVVYFR
jgi:hypothetical protein